MPETLLLTKLFVPPLRANLVPRPRLIERLIQGLRLGHKLTLISAPAGFGKTTLVCEWLDSLRLDTANESQIDSRIAWLSLDEGDNDPTRFLAYIIATLKQIEGIGITFGDAALNMLRSPQPLPTKAILTSLINDAAEIPDRIILVLDDYHNIQSSAVDDALTFILEHLPPQMHLVVATREDPNLQISRLHSRGQLTELRAADLRFSASEAADFLNQVMGLNLSSGDIAELETRTEGWIAGLQLAAISMQGRDDHTGFIKSFTGSNRLVLDYLVEEVLDQLSENIQDFLLQTAILNRLTGPLCDALTGQENGQEYLELLDNANLFIVPLDEDRCWYRYHHLFAGLLRQRLKYAHKNQLENLHLQASKWYEQNHLTHEAIDHAFQANDIKRAANLIAKEAEAVWERNEEEKLRQWLDKLPEENVFSIPQLWIFHAWSLFITGQHKSAEQMLENIDLTLNPRGNSNLELAKLEPIQLNEIEKMKIQGRIETIRAYIGFFRGDEHGMVTHLQKALEYLPKQDLSWRSMVSNSLADAYAFLGKMTKAYQARLDALEVSKAAGNRYQLMLANLKLATNYRQRGQLQTVLEICQQQYQTANQLGMSDTVVGGWLLTIWGEALAEINDLKSAVQKTRRGVELTENSGDVATLGWGYLSLIRVLFSNGELNNAEHIVMKMEKTARELNMLPWMMDGLAGWKVRIWLKQNKLDAAILWAKDQKLDISGEITSINEAKYMALARILLTQGQTDNSLNLLERLWNRAKSGDRSSMMIEILILQALALQAEEDISQAVSTLERAINLAEPRGFIRIFVDEGPLMARLLYEALYQGIAPDYIQRLLAVFPVAEPKQSASIKTEVDQSKLIEPLSDREIEVLQLIADGLTNQEISSRLYLSVNTTKTHTRNIYAKLGVHTRTQAIARGRAFGLIRSA